MKKKLIIMLSLTFLCTSFFGCSKKTADIKSDNSLPTNAPVNQSTKISPYTGEECDNSSSNNIPIMAIVENSRTARPQSGLNKADIVYETMAEGGIPRFISLFQRNNVKKIGPIRSVRPYFIDLTLEYNLPFAHCGGSDEALNRIKKEHLMSMNEFSYGNKYFWRDSLRKSPHNLYTSTEKLGKLAASCGYLKPCNVNLKFDKSFWEGSSLNNAKNISITPNVTYNTTYTYKNDKYYKAMDNTPSIDNESKEPITTKNIVIQFTNIKVQKDNSHLDIDLVGSGSGYVVSNGKFVKINWQKDSLTSQTILTDANKNPVFLNPGNTWWHIVDKKTKVKIN